MADTPKLGAWPPRSRLLWLTALVLAGSLLSFFAWRPSSVPIASGVPVTLALPSQINSAPAIVALAQGLFAKVGVEVIEQPFLLGKDALKSVLEGHADLAVVADTPLMFAILSGQDVRILASISQARRALAIVARNDRNIHAISDLQGKSVALTLGTNFPYFLDAMLNVNKVPSASVQRIDLKVDEVISAVKEGRSDAAVVFQPFLAKLEMDMGEHLQVFYGEDVYAFRFLLVAKPAYIEAHPEEIRRVLQALALANQSIQAQPLAARQAIGAKVQVDDLSMAKLFNPQDYALTLDQAMLLALDDQTRWAMQQGLVKAQAVPNYLTFISPKSLADVQPSAVKIVY